MYTNTQGRVNVVSGCTFEYIASQLESKAILCVRDGYELLTYSSLSELPQDLTRDFKKNNKSISTTEYHWRSSSSQSSYAYFSGEVDNHLRKLEERNTIKKLTLVKRENKGRNVIVTNY